MRLTLSYDAKKRLVLFGIAGLIAIWIAAEGLPTELRA